MLRQSTKHKGKEGGNMRHYLLLAAAVTMVLFAQAVTATPTSDPLKWSQLPDMNRGLDFSSEVKVPSVVADDWLCTNGLPITDIHWWGSYWVPRIPVPPDGSPNSDSLPNAPAGGVQAFVIKIYTDIPAGQGVPYSQPGQLLYTIEVPITIANEVYYGTTNAGMDVYQYYLKLAAPVPQERGQVYWLSIEAIFPDPYRQWGWHESKDHWNDAAVQDFKGSGWVALQNNMYLNDMAFELTTIPEPGSLIALGSGITGLLGLLLRKRRD